ncbi:MAG: Brp/Blh family beta-carotene 15,15'-dioxygenase [Terracoccus sp.]
METLRGVPASERERAPRAGFVSLRDVPWLTWAPVLAMLMLFVANLVAPEGLRTVTLPIAIVGALAGLPHGAVDHLLPGWLLLGASSSPGGQRRRVGARDVVWLLVGYLFSAAAMGALLVLAPAPTLIAFLVVAGAHFGWGEVTAGADRRGARLALNLVSVLHALAVGLVTVGLIVWSQPDATDPIVRAMSPTVADLAITSRSAGLSTVVVVVGAALAALLWRRQGQQAFELVLLALVFATCPPLAAFGVYFGLWHAVRFTGRLVDAVRLHDGLVSRVDHGGAAAVRHLTRLSVAPTAVALVAVGVIISLSGVVTIQAQVAVLLAVTFPHAAVVAWLDARRSSGQEQTFGSLS